MNLTPKQQTAETVLGYPVKWTGPDVGHCPCPGKDLHTTKNGDKDCRIHLSPTVQDGNVIPPNISCFHVQCKEVREGMNVLLRNGLSAVSEANEPILVMPYDPAREQREGTLRKLAANAKRQRSKILSTPWTQEEMLRESPNIPNGDIGRQRKDHFLLFEKVSGNGGLVWCGTKYSSGKEQHKNNFRSYHEWAFCFTPTEYEFICPSLFKPGSTSRSKENVLSRPFLVVEADTLDANPEINKVLCGAIFRYLRDEWGLRLRGVVDTAGKSLHGWFEMPPSDVLEALEVVLPILGCDPKVFNPAQPVRLAGAVRQSNKHYQTFCYYDCQ